jgi:imidazolonepropionase-like amidohydrolase
MRRGIPVVTHTVTVEGAKVAAAAGVDALGHGIGDALVDDELIALMKANGTAYVPTMVVFEPQQDRVLVPAELGRLAPPERAREEPRQGRPPIRSPNWRCAAGRSCRRICAG